MNKFNINIKENHNLLYFVINIKKEKDLFNILYSENLKNVLNRYLINENYYEFKMLIDSLELSEIIEVNLIDVCQN